MAEKRKLAFYIRLTENKPLVASAYFLARV